METLTPAPVEDTSTATEQVATPEAPPKGLHEMTRSERQTFLSEGKSPASDTVSDDRADSSTAPAEGQKAAETAAKSVKAASEPAAPAKDKKARNSEENRVSELLSDRQRERERADRAESDTRELRQRLEALERGSKSDGQPASSTKDQPDEPKWKAVAAAKEFPKILDFEDPNEWAAAVHLHTQQAIEAGLSAKETQTAEESQHRQVLDTAYAKGAKEVEADPTIMDRINPGLEHLKASRHLPKEQRNVASDIKDFVTYETDKPLGLMAFYSTPEGQQEWRSMLGMAGNGVAIQRVIIARELQLGSAVPQGDAAKDKKSNAKTFTKSPTPPEKEGPKGATASDPAAAAVHSGDYAELERTLDAQGDGLQRRYGRHRNG